MGSFVVLTTLQEAAIPGIRYPNILLLSLTIFKVQATYSQTQWNNLNSDTLSKFADGGGGVGDGVPAGARDVSTWWGSGRYWTQEQTLKVGILIGNKVSGKSYVANEGWRFKVFWKPVKSRLVGRI